MRRYRWTATLAVLVAAISTTACGSDGPQETAASATLVVDTVFNLKTADPARMYEPTGNLVLRPVYESLLTFDRGDVTTLVPGLAELPEVSQDATEFRFTLRQGAVFADGAPVTAADVVFSLNRVRNLEGSPAFLLDGVTASAPDERTVLLATEESDPGLPNRIANPALGVLRAEVVKQQGGTDQPGASTSDKAEAYLNGTSAGSGPYVLRSYDPTTEVVLERNAKYWGQAPRYQRIVVRNVPAPTQRLNVLQGASQVALDLSPDQAADLQGKAQVLRTPSSNVIFLYANLNPAASSVTAAPGFAEAVRYGIDYASLVDLGGDGSAQSPGVIPGGPNGFVGALGSGDAVKRDLDRAKAALATSGAAGTEINLVYASDQQINGVDLGDLAARVQQNLREVGITVTLRPAPVQTALDTYRAGTDAMGLWWWGPDYPDPSDYLVFAPGELVGLRAGWAADGDAEVTGLAEAARTATGDGRAGAYEAFQRGLNERGPFVPLLQPAQVIAHASSVQNVHYNPVWLIDLDELG